MTVTMLIDVIIITHNSTIYLIPPYFFVINHASSSSVLMKQHNNVGVAHRCPQSSTPEQQPINIIGDINIVEANQHKSRVVVRCGRRPEAN
jgi:hypothetical protein